MKTCANSNATHKEKKTLVIVYDSLNIGGIETLIIRMAKWCHSNGHRCIWARTKFAQVEEQMRVSLVAAGIEEVFVKKKWNSFSTSAKFYNLNNFDFPFKKGEEITVLSFDLLSFLLGEAIKRRYVNHVDNVFYVPHPWTSYRDTRISKKLLPIKLCYYHFYRNIIISLIRNDNIVFMDEAAKDFCAKHYNYYDSINEWIIIRLAQDINPYKHTAVHTKFTREEFRVLTMGRLDFPFKAYVFGIVDSIHELIKEKVELKLKIIGYGAGEQRLVSYVNELPPNVRENIEIVGKVPYDELTTYFDEANLFVGVGTTLLDAANHSVPSIIATPYQEGVSTGGFFHECPELLGIIQGVGTSDIISGIKFIMKTSEEEYEDMCIKTHQALTQYYDINLLLPKLLSVVNKSRKPIISDIRLRIINLLALPITVLTFVALKIWKIKGLR